MEEKGSERKLGMHPSIACMAWSFHGGECVGRNDAEGEFVLM